MSEEYKIAYIKHIHKKAHIDEENPDTLITCKQLKTNLINVSYIGTVIPLFPNFFFQSISDKTMHNQDKKLTKESAIIVEKRADA